MESLTAHAARVRIQIHYVEMPGLRLSRTQIARLCGVPDHLCTDALATLVWTGFLVQTADGSFVRTGTPRADTPDLASGTAEARDAISIPR